MEYYGNYNFRITYVAGLALFPIAGVKTKNTMNFQQNICSFTIEGRRVIHDKLKGINYDILRYLMENPLPGKTTEYNDNRVSLYVGQNGRCSITGKPLQIGNMEVHHKIPRKLGGKDEYANLTFVDSDIHKLIHAANADVVQKYMDKLKKCINKENIKKVNKLRNLIGNCELYIS
jgi:5-methylcytosine-specific restriction endonuclease McrA